MLAKQPELREIVVNEQVRTLAKRYVEADIFPESIVTDALHVAAAVLSRCDVLLSWNFKHLVNRRRRAAVISLNVTLGLPSIEFVAPPEL